MEEKEKQGTNASSSDVLNPDDFEEESNSSKGADDQNEDDGDESESSKSTKSEEDLEKERRAEFARKRREREANEKAERERRAREEQLIKEATTKAELGLINENPYTKKPIRDAKDLEIYKIQKKLDEEGKDPLADLPEAIAEIEREREKRAKEQIDQQKTIDDQLKQEISELRQKYPDVNTKELADDPLYQEIAEEKAGRWTVLEIYEECLRRRKSSEQSEETEKTNEEINEIAKKGTKSPSSSGGSTNSGKSIDDMTPEEFQAYWNNKYNQ